MDKLNVGVIGFGVGLYHAKAYENHPFCNLVSLCDFDNEKFESAKALFPSVSVTKNADDILENKDLDIVSIASFDNYHFDQVVKAIKNEKHVFIARIYLWNGNGCCIM